MTPSNIQRPVDVALAVAVCLTVLSGCSNAPVSPDRLAALESVLATCPVGSDAAVDVRIDESRSRRRDSLTGDPRRVVVDALTKAAVCGHGAGRFRLDLFSSSIAASSNVVDLALSTAGGTDIARLRKVPTLVNRAIHLVDNHFLAAVRSLPSGGTDLPAQLFAAKEFIVQASAEGTGTKTPLRLTLVLLTDGESTTASSRIGDNASIADARRIARSTLVPDLSNSTILVVGVGQTVNGPTSSSTYVAALKSYLLTLGTRSRAKKVTVVTAYTGQGL